MNTYNLFLKLLLTRLHPSPYDYALVLHGAHSSTEWNIWLIIKQTINKSTLFTKKKSSTGSLHYKELCEEQCWPGGFFLLHENLTANGRKHLHPGLSRSRLTDKPVHTQQRGQRAALACSHCICAILAVSAVSADL